MGIMDKDMSRGSFTVEATFVVMISIWIVLIVCYVSMYAHDEATLYSIGKNYMEISSENGSISREEQVAEGMRKYLQKHVLIGQIKNVSIEKRLLYVQAEFEYEAKVRMPFVKRLLTGTDGKKVVLTHERYSPTEQMWDYEMLEN